MEGKQEKTCVCILKLYQKRPTYASLLRIFESITANYNFLPTARADFYFKVILPSVSYGLVVWGSCNKSLFDDLEKIHVVAEKIIYGLDWYSGTQRPGLSPKQVAHC